MMPRRFARENPYEQYEIPSTILEQYSSRKWLFKPEELILERLTHKLSEAAMLDIGVGAGRTTWHFAHRVQRYVGIDFNADMIEACRRSFPHLAEDLIRCDARSMDAFADGSFDFILFSCNGLDYLSPQDRLQALREIKRVGKKGASFLFSSENLNNVDRLFNFRPKLSSNPRTLLGGLRLFAVLTLLNESPRALKARDFAVIYNGNWIYFRRLSWFLLSLKRHIGFNYYIKPQAQVRQLHGLGFTQVEVFARDGRTIAGDVELAALQDDTVHYLCQI